jgi:hypothetical protein
VALAIRRDRPRLLLLQRLDLGRVRLEHGGSRNESPSAAVVARRRRRLWTCRPRLCARPAGSVARNSSDVRCSRRRRPPPTGSR